MKRLTRYPLSCPMHDPAPRPQRILFVSHVSSLGGAELSLLDLLGSPDRRRYALRVVVPARGELSERLEAAEIPFDCCAFLRRLHRSKRPHRLLAQAAWVAAGGFALRGLVRRHRPHLVHANSTISALYALCLPRPPCPVIWHLRDLSFPRLIGRFLARRCASIVVPSRACRRLVDPIADSGKIKLIPNGIRIAPPAAGGEELRREIAPGAGLVAVVIGQLAPWKGHALALEAARRVCGRNPEVRFVIAGDDRFGDHPGAFEGLERRVRELGLEGAVRLLGHRPDVRSILACADLLVHPAYPEPFGRVVVEAMAEGCAVVAFAGEHGPAEILRDGVDGVLVAPRTSAALAAAILDLAARPAVREQLGEKGRQRAAAFYDRAHMARGFTALYDTLISDRRE